MSIKNMITFVVFGIWLGLCFCVLLEVNSFAEAKQQTQTLLEEKGYAQIVVRPATDECFTFFAKRDGRIVPGDKWVNGQVCNGVISE